jgi:phage gp29-like protein
MVTRKSTILGPDGRAIEISGLSEEIAQPALTGNRQTHSDREATGLTPEKLASILQRAATGDIRSYLTLAEEMEERYLHYASQLQTRRLAIESLGVSVEADESVPTKIVDAVKTLIENDGFDDTLGFLTDGIAKGFATVEMCWEYEQKLLQPVKYIARDQRFFQFERVGLSELRLVVDGNADGEILPEAKFLRHMPRSKMGIPIRRGVARPAAWAYLIQTFGLQDWSAFAEIYGIPFRVGRYHSAASENDKRTLLRAVTMIANDGAAIIPQGMDFEFHEVNGSRGEAVFGGLLDYVDKQISKLVVGQTMTSDDGSSLGQAKIHNEVRLDILRADGKQLASTINRDLIRPFVDLNFGPQNDYPRVELPVPDPEDVEALSSSLAQLVPLGLKVGQREVRDKLGLSDPGEEEDLLTPPSPQPSELKPPDARAIARQAGKQKLAKLSAGPQNNPHGQGCMCPSCASFAATGAGRDDAVGELEELFEQLSGFEQMSAPLFKPFLDILAEAESYDEAIAMLNAVRPDAGPFVEKLAELTAIARGIGDVRD